MNRTIKFRAWNSEKKLMGYFDLTDFVAEEKYGDYHAEAMCSDAKGSFVFSITSSDTKYAIVMQFTGLTDKNGKEIYEGDIVHLVVGNRGGSEFVGDIYWNGDEARWTLRHPKGYHGHFGVTRDIIEVLEKWEIIGNIHENPELLK